jgi:hypothetical protein
MSAVIRGGRSIESKIKKMKGWKLPEAAIFPLATTRSEPVLFDLFAMC